MKLQFETDRLTIHTISLDDLDKIHELHSLPEVDKFNTLGIPENKVQTQRIILQWMEKNAHHESFTFKIKSKKTTEFIGLIAIHLASPKFKSAEVWYKLHPNFWHQGFATEALRKILAFGFTELNLHRIEAGCAVANTGSINVLEKVGMLREGRKRKILPLKSGWSDNFHYAILSTDFYNASSDST